MTQVIVNEMYKGNFSFLILVVCILQLLGVVALHFDNVRRSKRKDKQ